MREICMSGSTRGWLMSDPAGMVRGSRVRRNVRSPNGIVHQRSTLLSLDELLSTLVSFVKYLSLVVMVIRRGWRSLPKGKRL